MSQLDAIAEIRDDHKKVIDTLLEIIDAIRRRDVTKAFKLLTILDKLGGPHFRA